MAKPLETITAYEKMTEAELEAHALLVPKYKQARINPRKELIKPEGPYNLAEIEEDEAEVARLEEIFKKTSAERPEWQMTQKRAELFEALLGEGIELNDWFGEEASTIFPSRYDDIKNGIDILVEFSSGGFAKHLGLSVDVTTSAQSIAEKIDKIRRDIRNGRLARIKYFSSESTGDKGVKNDIPKVVIGADFKLVRELAGIWLNLSKAKEERMRLEKDFPQGNPRITALKTRIKDLQKKLTGHRAQFQILEEVRFQLQHFINLAKEHNKDLLIQKYSDALDTVNSILSEKSFELPEEEQLLMDKDTVYQAIVREVS